MVKKLHKNILRAALSLATVSLIPTLSSCDGMIYESEGDCVVTYNLRFVYDMNLKWADAFPSEVHSVHLYAFNSDGLFVKDYVVNGDPVDKEGYLMQLDLDPGKYTLVAWCGMDNAGSTKQDFTVPSVVPGRTKLQDLTCSLNVQTDGAGSLSSNGMLDFLYHGILDVDLPDVFNGDFYYTMHLTKDTNHIRIILQQLSTEDMNPDEFEFKIEDANSVMGFDNAMLSNDVVTYSPWDIATGEAGMLPDDATDNELVYTDGIIADFSTSRLMADHSKSFMLTITSEDKTVAKVPLLQYALMSREYFEQAYGHTITNQDLLDRQDEYIFTFFLDDSKRWTEMHINIYSWRMVIQNYEM